MKLSDAQLREILAVFDGVGWATDVLEELLAARKVVEEVRVRTDDMGFFNGSAHNLRTSLHAYDKATEGE